MMERIAGKLTDWLVSQKVIAAGERDIYVYGIFQMMMNILDTISILLLAVFFHKMLVVCCYMACFCLLRKYAGGYHAKSVTGCYIMTVGSAFIMLAAAGNCRLPVAVVAAVWLISGIMVFLFAPVQNHNKKLDEVERLVYRRRAVVVWVLESILTWILYGLNFTEEVAGILFSNVFIAISMLAELAGETGHGEKRDCRKQRCAGR